MRGSRSQPASRCSQFCFSGQGEMYPSIRRIHLSTGLFCLAFLAMYEISALQMAHRRWFPPVERVAQQSFVITTGLTDARVAARALGIRGELTAARPSPQGLRFRIVRPGTVS